MEANRDEARRCIKIAEKWIQAGNIEKGEKFLKKSIHLYFNERATDLLQQLRNSKNRSKRPQNNESNTGRRFAASGAFTEYTREQLENVQRVNKCKNLYDILGVKRDAKADGIKKIYKKLALKLHPDKNKAPGATDAFRALVTAMEVLTDKEKRKVYDLSFTNNRKKQ